MDERARLREIVSYYVSTAEQGRLQDAFHGLIDQARGIVPHVEEAYRAETRMGMRVLLLEVVAEFRDRSSIGFFETALADASPEIWKVSLDGLVSTGGQESLAALERSVDSLAGQGVQRIEWIGEAIEQVREAL